MRDGILTLVIFGLLPKCFTRPDIGIMVFCWLSYMNPHRLCWGFALSMPFAQLVAMATIGGLIVSKEPKKIPWTLPSILILIFLLWMLITTIFAFNQAAAWQEFNQVWKIQLITFLITILMTSKERIINLIWVMAMSLGYYGFKGGLFTIVTGGRARVWGPDGTFIGGNNEIGLAMLMTIPLLRYLQLNTSRPLIKNGLTAGMILSLFCVLGTQSRGALVGMAAMLMFLVLKSRNKLPLLLVLAISIPVALSMMPESWYARMHTIKSYQQDGSAMGRINAWHTSVNIAKDRIVGGGYKCLHMWDTFQLYAPDRGSVHDAHSIYFEVLGEHGIIGLILFLLIGLTGWHLASNTIKLAKKDPAMKWIADLCSMIQVSFVGYASAGLFLGLAMFDFYYNLIAVVIACHVLASKKNTGALVTPESPPIMASPSRSPSFVRPPIRNPNTAARRLSGDTSA